MPDTVIHVSSVAGSPLARLGGRAARASVEDVVARLGPGDALPPVIGLKARIGGRELFVPIDRIEQLGPGDVRTSTTKLNLAQFERRPGRGAAALRRARPQPDQRRHGATRDRARGRAGLRGRHMAGRRASIRASARGSGGCCRAASAATTAEHRQFVAWRRSSRSSATSRPRA